MANDNERPPHAPGSFNPTTRYARVSTSRSNRSYGSHDTGESSSTAGESSTAQETSLTGIAQPEHHATIRAQHSAKEDGRRRSYRPRPTGGFLLADPVYDEKSGRKSPLERDEGRRRSRIPVDSRRAKSPMYSTPDKARYSSEQDADKADIVEGTAARKDSGKGRRSGTSKIPSPIASQPVDLDSTQIVSMALNLSESRRLAQRRNVSNPVPRLAQVPDSPVGGSLKQHLHQQRRTSRNISPRPEKSGLAPRSVSVSQQRIVSPLQASFDPDSTYTYHFSSSTLNRAQKAKEHFELMAQYRRLLNLVPPLQYKGQTSRPSTSSPPTSPTAPSSSSYPFSGVHSLGRPYDPLQYIRNRKVRARERKAIDGEAQGFSDVHRVVDWVDQAATMAVTSPYQPENMPCIPIFPSAHTMDEEDAGPSASQLSNALKPKRPRVDWIVEPADLIADLYWVEQDDNKSLIEDRHYTRIFPQAKKPAAAAATPLRPLTRETDDYVNPSSVVTPMSHVTSDGSEGLYDRDLSDSNAISRADTETSHISARDRARQKLHELRSLHHRHNSPTHGHRDFLHLRKTSYSDTSDSEVDRQKRERSGTISANSKALLEKQMNEILAKEAIVTKRATPQDINPEREIPFRPVLMTPDKSPGPPVVDPTRKHSRLEGHDVDRSDHAQVRHGSPVRSGGASLEIPRWTNRASMDFDTSAPSSPDLRASKSGGNYIPAIGMDLSPPSSRPESPVRNPFSKVKSMFRDRSRERSRDRSRERANGSTDPSRDEKLDSTVEEADQPWLSPIATEGIELPGRRRSRSPAQKTSRAETHKSHKSMGSLRLGKEDQAGLRSILKGSAKIDGIIRGGVSKVSDLFWKKVEEGDSVSPGTSSDESDVEPTRGRIRTPAASPDVASLKSDNPHRERHYLDAMPAFKSASATEKSGTPETSSILVSQDHPSQTPSRRSSRFDQLKPPRIDVLNASPSSSPLSTSKFPELQDTELIDSDSPPRSLGATHGAVHESTAKLNALLSLPAFSDRVRRSSTSLTRHWSISDRSPSPRPDTQLSKREAARLRTLALSSGIKAMEIARRAAEPQPMSTAAGSKTILPIPWNELSPFVPDPHTFPVAVPQLEVYATTGQVLASSIESSDTALERSASAFITGDMRQLHNRVDTLHARVATDLIDMTRRAADEADECSRDMVDSQRLKVKRVVDIIEKMLRRRRRRFRWARRGGWLMVEWALVGFMWYVWFVVMILRIFLGIGRGTWNSVRWLLWL